MDQGADQSWANETYADEEYEYENEINAQSAQNDDLAASVLTSPASQPSVTGAQPPPPPPTQQLLSANPAVTSGNSDNAGDGDETEEEEDASPAPSGRQSRTARLLSDPVLTISRPIVFPTREIGHTGNDSGRNLLAIFAGSDGVRRTRYNLRILRGRAATHLPNVTQYPDSNTLIPGGLTLVEICRSYPRHVWGTGLRLFIAERWTGEQIFHALPASFRGSKAVQRPWNFLQQAFTRETTRIEDEERAIAAMASAPAQQNTVNVTGNHSSDNDSDGGATLLPAPQHPHIHPVVMQAGPPPQPIQSSFAMYPATPYRPVFDRGAELDRQERLLLDILAWRTSYRNESFQDRMDRVRYGRIQLLQQIGVDFNVATDGELVGLTIWLEEEHTRARQELQRGI